MTDMAGAPLGSLDTGIRALMLFLDGANLSVTQVSGELGISRSSAHRILATLEFRGLVGRGVDGWGYSAGPILSDLSLPYGLDQAVQRWVAPVIDDAVERTGAIIYTSALLGTRSILLAGRMPPNPPARNLTGLTRPAYTTSSGMLLLSRLRREEVDALYPEERLFRTAVHPAATRVAFLESLEIVRRRGYATSTTHPNGDGVAILLTGTTWRDMLTLQAVIRKGEGTPERLEELATQLHESAATLDHEARPSIVRRRGLASPTPTESPE